MHILYLLQLIPLSLLCEWRPTHLYLYLLFLQHQTPLSALCEHLIYTCLNIYTVNYTYPTTLLLWIVHTPQHIFIYDLLHQIPASSLWSVMDTIIRPNYPIGSNFCSLRRYLWRQYIPSNLTSARWFRYPYTCSPSSKFILTHLKIRHLRFESIFDSVVVVWQHKWIPSGVTLDHHERSVSKLVGTPARRTERKAVDSNDTTVGQYAQDGKVVLHGHLIACMQQ